MSTVGRDYWIMCFSPATIHSARKEKKCPFLEKFSGKVVITSSRLVPARAWKWKEGRFGNYSQPMRISWGLGHRRSQKRRGQEQS